MCLQNVSSKLFLSTLSLFHSEAHLLQDKIDTQRTVGRPHNNLFEIVSTEAPKRFKHTHCHPSFLHDVYTDDRLICLHSEAMEKMIIIN